MNQTEHPRNRRSAFALFEMMTAGAIIGIVAASEHPRNRRSGFTLLEIMTVVVIIGIVAGMAVMVMNPKELSDEARRKMTIAKIQDTVGAMTLYEINKGKKATSWQQLMEDGKLTSIPIDAWGKPLELKAGVISSDAGGSGKPITSEKQAR